MLRCHVNTPSTKATKMQRVLRFRLIHTAQRAKMEKATAKINRGHAHGKLE